MVLFLTGRFCEARPSHHDICRLFLHNAIAACQFAATPTSQCLPLTKTPLLTRRHTSFALYLHVVYFVFDLRRSGISKHSTPRQIGACTRASMSQVYMHLSKHRLCDGAKLGSRHIPLAHPSIQAQCRYAHLQSKLNVSWLPHASGY